MASGWPRIEAVAVQEMAVRMPLCRDRISVGRNQGGSAPDSLMENETAIIKDTRRAKARFLHASQVQ
ncbi:hypothetical protein BN439_2258 [Erwinia amylovora Ea644]|uniref:hypothetical protein n=1 Tax=Erwinia amylovora TaxID=552 RepID=UPI0002CBB481|nr:hypothetical protein [Erwinia amylovora]CCP03313.1 hypothetical protein BN439_2258 [Erwinia amylovora Ea644]CCP07323.1 hypothetical protein BN440_2301 [Erwinia amylovora MR1]